RGRRERVKGKKPAHGSASKARARGGEAEAGMDVPEGGAVVRMYCTGLGDCFLIGLPAADGETGYVLIDCGVWKGTPGAREWMTRIMTHVKETVGARGVDVVVATHAAWRNLCGCGQARGAWGTLQ